MNKKIAVILLVTFLLIGGVINLFADKEVLSTEDAPKDYGSIELQPESQVIPCGEGNGGGAPG